MLSPQRVQSLPMGDYHVHLHPHLPVGPDDPEPGTFPQDLIERYVDAALGRGLTELCFTEHLYRTIEGAAVLGEFWADEEPFAAEVTRNFVTLERDISLDTYVAAIVEARDRGLPVRLGLEVDYFPETIDAVLDLLAPYPWDVLIGSVHWIGGFAIDSADMEGEFERRGLDRVYARYFALEEKLAASGAVDVLAHADVVKKLGHRLPAEPFDAYEAVARAAAASGTAVEVSSAGLRKPAAEIYPAPAFLQRFHHHRVPITLASDAHRPDEVGDRFDEVRAAARTAGYTTRLTFDKRVATDVPL